MLVHLLNLNFSTLSYPKKKRPRAYYKEDIRILYLYLRLHTIFEPTNRGKNNIIFEKKIPFIVNLH